MSTIFDLFKLRAEAVNAEVHRFPTKALALQFITEFLAQQRSATDADFTAVWADCAFLDGVDKKELAAAAPQLRFDATREVVAETRIGISQFEWGIANTGTLVQDASGVDDRLVSMLPLIHIALVSSDAVVPDLPALLSKTGPQVANYLAFVSGPSRTADIERVLTIGVHGPERLIILCVDELPVPAGLFEVSGAHVSSAMAPIRSAKGVN
jgi:L-lactate dehydrogenase complex protein LldG